MSTHRLAVQHVHTRWLPPMDQYTSHSVAKPVCISRVHHCITSPGTLYRAAYAFSSPSCSGRPEAALYATPPTTTRGIPDKNMASILPQMPPMAMRCTWYRKAESTFWAPCETARDRRPMLFHAVVRVPVGGPRTPCHTTQHTPLRGRTNCWHTVPC